MRRVPEREDFSDVTEVGEVDLGRSEVLRFSLIGAVASGRQLDIRRWTRTGGREEPTAQGVMMPLEYLPELLAVVAGLLAARSLAVSRPSPEPGGRYARVSQARRQQ